MGLWNYLEHKQQDFMYHRAVLLYYYVLGVKGIMVQHKPTIGHKHPNEHSPKELNKNRVHRAPCHSVRVCTRQFEYMVLGKP